MPQNDAGGVEGTLPASGDRTIALRERRSGGKGDDLKGIQHTGFFTMPGAALKGEEFEGPKSMQGQVPQGGGAALEKGEGRGIHDTHLAGRSTGEGGKQDMQDSGISLPTMLHVENRGGRIKEKQVSVIRSSAVEDVGDLDLNSEEEYAREKEEKWTKIERRGGKRKAEPEDTSKRKGWVEDRNGEEGSQAREKEEDGGDRTGEGHKLRTSPHTQANLGEEEVVLVTDGLCLRPCGLLCWCHVCYPPPPTVSGHD
jgi:hypothetical protein